MDKLIKRINLAGFIALFLSVSVGYWIVGDASAQAPCDLDPYCHTDLKIATDYEFPCMLYGCDTYNHICCLEEVGH